MYVRRPAAGDEHDCDYWGFVRDVYTQRCLVCGSECTRTRKVAQPEQRRSDDADV